MKMDRLLVPFGSFSYIFVPLYNSLLSILVNLTNFHSCFRFSFGLESMGVFKYNGNFNNYPSYKNLWHQWLYLHPSSGWLIGSSLGNPTGYVHNGERNPCPYFISRGWMYVQNGQWIPDNSLVVRCIA